MYIILPLKMIITICELLCELIVKYVYGFTKIKRISLLFVKQIDDNVVTGVINW